MVSPVDLVRSYLDRIDRWEPGKSLAASKFLALGEEYLADHFPKFPVMPGVLMLQACVDEFKENEDLPNTTNPDDWARISGKKGERIVFIRTLITGKQGTEPGRSIDTVANTGQYL